MPKTLHLSSLHSVLAINGELYYQSDCRANIVFGNDQIKQDCRGRCIKLHTIHDYGLVDSVHTSNSFGPLLIHFQLKDDGWFFVRALLLLAFPTEKATKVKYFTFNDVWSTKFVALAVFSLFLLYLEKQPSEELVRKTWNSIWLRVDYADLFN